MKSKTKWIIVVFFIVVSIFGPAIVEGLFEIGNNNNNFILSSNFKPEIIVDFFGQSLSAIATILLGALALHQNEAFKNENDKSQTIRDTYVAKLANSNKKNVDINERLLHLEELMAQEYVPLLKFETNEIPIIEPLNETISVKKENYISIGLSKEKTNIYYVYIYNHKLSDLQHYQVILPFTLINSSKSIIKEVIFKSIILDNPNDGNLSNVIHFNYDLSQVSQIPLLLPGNILDFKFVITCDVDFYNYLNHGTFFRFDLNLCTTTITDLKYIENIVFSRNSSMIISLNYSCLKEKI